MRSAFRECENPALQFRANGWIEEMQKSERNREKTGNFYELEDRDELDDLIALAPGFLFVCAGGDRWRVDCRFHCVGLVAQKSMHL